MKKFVALLLAAVMMLSVVAVASAEDMRVAMITDYGDITDQSFNQTTYEAGKAWCEANGVDFTYYKPAGDSSAERVAMVEKAVDEDYNVIIMPGFAFADTIGEVQDEYPEVRMIAIDVDSSDLDHVAPNLYCCVYQEQYVGYLAGYSAVKLGYKHVGYLGGMAVPAVVRYGYGFVEGVNAAAEELGIADQVTLEYVYGNQFYGDADITAYMDNWYQNLGVEVVFACGGGIYTSAAEAAAKVGGKVIGVDVDQSGVIDGLYGEGITLSSAMKGLAGSVNSMLNAIKDGIFDENYGGKAENLGITSPDPALNAVQLSETTQFADGFTKDDYNAMVAAMYNGEITVSNDFSAIPATTITLNELGTVK